MTSPMRFSYRGARHDGSIESGELAAESREALVSALAARGLWATEIRASRGRSLHTRRLTADNLALGLRVMATLLDSGLPIGRSLAVLPDVAPIAWTAALPEIQQTVREGASLASALERSALAMPAVVIGIIRAGEAGSGLAVAVRRAATLMEEAAATRRDIHAALVYPAVLGVAGIASVGILVGVVLPRFASILGDLGQALPRSTRVVLYATTLVRVGWFPTVLTALIICAAWKAWLRTPAGAQRWAGLLLDVPLVGGIRRSTTTARVCAALAALLDSGVPFSAALTHAARASGDAAVAARVLAARAVIIAGARPSAALLGQSAVTSIAARLIRTGEETGTLAMMLSHAGHLEAERAMARVRTGVRLLEPALILAFGGLVALVAAALLQAIYGVRPT